VQVAKREPGPEPGNAEARQEGEEIRFGQAPRENAAAGNTRQVDAGATAAAEPQQVASNDTGKEVAVTNAEGQCDRQRR